MGLSDGTRRALAAALHEAGYTLVARLLAEGDEPKLIDALADPFAEFERARLRANASGVAQVLLIVPAVDSYEPPEMMPRFPPKTHALVDSCPGCGAAFGRTYVMVASDAVRCDQCRQTWVVDSVAERVPDFRRLNTGDARPPNLIAAEMDDVDLDAVAMRHPEAARFGPEGPPAGWRPRR
jgi:hypothetical protein